eukprot:2575764-Prymnesium_polylepis.1
MQCRERQRGGLLNCVRLQRDHLTLQSRGSGHCAALKRSDRLGEPWLPESETLLRRAKELSPLLLLLDLT